MQYFKLEDHEKFHNALVDEKTFMETVECIAEPDHLRIGRRGEQLYIRLPSSKIGDFVWTWGSDCIITEKVKMLFEEAQFTGYRLHPVVVERVYKKYTYKDIVPVDGQLAGVKSTIRDRNPQPIPPLWELIITGDAGESAPGTGIELLNETPCCGFKTFSDFYNGLFVNEKTWDGSDFFNIYPLARYIIVTERVKVLIEKHKLTNIKCTPTEQLQSSGYGISWGGKWEDRYSFIPDKKG